MVFARPVGPTSGRRDNELISLLQKQKAQLLRLCFLRPRLIVLIESETEPISAADVLKKRDKLV